MRAVSKFDTRGIARPIRLLHLVSLGLVLQCATSTYAHAAAVSKPGTVQVRLSEWKVALSSHAVPSGPVVFEVANTGTIPHAFEVEGRGLEKSTPQIQAGATATLKLDLSAGSYELYCPVGKGSHKMLGMISHLTVGPAKPTSAVSRAAKETAEENEHGEEYASGQGHDEMDEHVHSAEHGDKHGDGDEEDEYGAKAKSMTVVGGGQVIQILPGPFPFADSAMTVIQGRPADQQADLTKKSHMGPYSNNVAKITGDISLTAIDRGASNDSVSGVAQFTAQDGPIGRW